MRVVMVVLGMALLAPMCPKKPTAEIEAAKHALEQARKEQAERYALEELRSAEDFLALAEKQSEEEKYDEARISAMTSKRFSEIAIEKARRAKEVLKETKEEEEKFEEEFKVPVTQPRIAYVPIPGVSPEDVISEGSVGRGYVLRLLKKVYFDFDKYELKENAREYIKENAKWLKANRDVRILIEGHCDERGTEDYNLALGYKRAKAVKNYLIRLGIAPERIDTVSYGEEFPEDPRHNEEAWAKNRRAVFVILPP